MLKRLFYFLAVSILLPVALIGLIAMFVNSAPAVDNSAAMQAGNTKALPNGIWSDLPNFPTENLGFNGQESTTGPLTVKRAGAVAYPPNGKVYILGGTHKPDGADIGIQWIYEYNPANNTLTKKNALLDPVTGNNYGYGDRYVANMAVAVLTDTNGPRIYAIGGSSVNSVITPSVRIYNPIADSETVLTSDPWPANPTRVPGAYAVYNNKLYIFGGHSAKPSTAIYADTWSFDPMAPAGSKWSQITSANLSVARGYMAGATLDGYIYAIGGDLVVSNTATPLSIVERMNPSDPNPTWQTMASLPSPRGDMAAWAYDTGSPYEIAGRIVVGGGGYPVPDTAAYVYNVSSNTWAIFPDMSRPRRNYAAAQLNGILYAWGGYDISPNVLNASPHIWGGSNSSLRYDASGPPPPPGITPTMTPIPSPTSCGADLNYTYTVSSGVALDPGTSLVQGTTCQTCVTGVSFPFPVQIYGQTFTQGTVGSTGNLQLVSNSPYWINRALPTGPFNYALMPFWDDLSLNSSHGVYTSVVGTAPNRTYNIEWRSTINDFEIRLFEGSTAFEYVYGTGSGGSGTIGVQKDMTLYTQVGYNVTSPTSGTKYSFTQAICGSPTPTVTGTPPTATRTNTPTLTPSPTATVCGGSANYNVTSSTGATVVPATNFVTGSNCDDCVNSAAIPFPFRLYDQTYSAVNLSSNGNAQFVSAITAYSNECLPSTTIPTYTIFPHWGDLLLTGTGQGIYTSVSGTAPNRIFNIEWIGGYYSGGGNVDLELRLYEASATGQFDVIYGTVTQTGTGATVGVQRDSGVLTQFECNTGGLAPGMKLTFQQPLCSTPLPTNTPVSTNTNTPIVPTNTPTRTNTPLPPTSTATAIATSTGTAIPISPTATNTVVSTSTNTPTSVPATATRTPTIVLDTATSTPTSVPGTATNTPTDIVSTNTATAIAPTSTNTAVVPPTGTSVPPTSTAVQSTSTAVPPTATQPPATATASATPTTCSIQFSDVPPGSTFYSYITCLACHGIVNGYEDGTFHPDSTITRGQLSKIVSNAAGLSDPPGAQIFEDVPPGSTFYTYTQRLTNIGVMSGYQCGDPEPCMPGNRPYFRPGGDASRGQISKIVSNAANYTEPPVGQTFEDVLPGSVFYTYTQRLATRGAMSGYQCGNPEPCMPGNRAYFRPFNDATRGQTSKIVANTFMQDCTLKR